jgi:phosphoribosyl 1,2-cyclic phosphate phosphodiesterase
MKIKFLGTADSAGIPIHNCKCKVCSYYREKKEENLSTSAYISIDGSVILLDAGLDRISSIFDGKKIEAIFLTHFHADHCLGLLRLRHSNDKISCYHPKDEIGFSDLFKHNHSICYNEINEKQTIKIKNISFTPLSLKHSKNTFGYVIEYKNKTIAYLTDCSGISKENIEFLKAKKIDYAFIDACYDERKETGNHLNYLQASEILDELNVKNGYVMHISHSTQEFIINNKVELKYKYVIVNDGFNLN